MYTNETSGIKNASPDNPIIIFDDFTTSAHYVNFPFKVKSSAMKLLTLKDKKDNIHCIFNILKNVKYVPVTHERHWISIFAKFKVLLPSSKEQKQIGNLFEQLDKLSYIHQRKCDEYKELKKGMLQKMFPRKGEKVPEVRFPGFTDDWEQCKISEITSTVPIKTYIRDAKDNGKYEVIQQGDTPILGYADGSPFMDYEKTTLFGDHTLSLYKTKSPFFVASDGLRILYSEGMDGCFYYYLLEKYKPESEGYKRHFSILKECECSFPKSENEKKKIGEYFSNLDNLITLHQRKCDEYKELKKGLLQQMFV